MKKSSSPLARFAREPVTLAIVFAVLIASMLTFAVLAVWSGGPSESNDGVVFTTVRDGPTPTPRTVHWPNAAGEATPDATPGTRPFTGVATVPEINAVTSPTAAASPATPPEPTASPEPTRTPEPTASPEPPTATPAPPPTATPSPAAAAVFEAAGADGFQQMATGGWYVDRERLVYDSPQATSQPWLLAPARTQSGDFAVEAEIRVDGVGEGYCNQSFGVVAGSEQAGTFWGGGVIYPCGSKAPRARLTDVSNWTDGYDQDRSLAGDGFNPRQDWHVYRIEVRGNELTLLIDGSEVLSATDSQLAANLRSGQAGLWSQGVRVTIKRLAIYEL